MPAPCIDVRGLVKRFGALTAVAGIDFSVAAGEAFAFLGPNGAGKTTTIKMLITLLAPSGGEATVAGCDLRREPMKLRRAIGYVPQLISVDGTLTAYENLMLFARLYDLSAAECHDRVSETLEFLQLETQAHRLVRTFSGGMIRKLEIGQATVHRPQVLFLDEPTTGLDPIGKASVWERLQALRQRFGSAIFFSTHNMEEASAVADRVAMMNAGRLAAIGTVAELIQMAGGPAVNLEQAFLRLAGNAPETAGFREARRERRLEGRLG